MNTTSALLGQLNHADSTRRPVILTLSLILGLCAVYLFAKSSPLPGNVPKRISRDWPLFGSLWFWSERWEFYKEAITHSATGNFSFHVGQNLVIGLSGDQGRKAFFESKDLDFTAGYSTLFGGSPHVSEKSGIEATEITMGYFGKRLTALLKHESMVKTLPALMSDTRKSLDDLASSPSRIINPFDSIYNIVYQLTMRNFACKEIADDPKLLNKTLSIFEAVEKGASTAAIMFPWLPTPGKWKRIWGGVQLYGILKKITDDRKAEGRREDDALQYLLDQGDDIRNIIGFILGSLYAGQLNTGIQAAWILVYLADNPEWLDRAREEVDAMIVKYSPDKSKGLAERISSIPVKAWETEFRVLDLCLKESIRVNLPGAAFRLNTGSKPIKVGQEQIPPGAYVAYHVGDIHYDAQIYPDPMKFDPGRYLSRRAEDVKREHAYLGWGVSRHPCLGMRFAKLEIFMIAAHFLSYFDFELCDKEGRTGARPPPTEVNYFAAKKPRQEVYIKYKPREN